MVIFTKAEDLFGLFNQSVGGDVEQSSWRQASSNFSSTTQCLFVKKITQQMIDDNPDVFKTIGLNDERMSAGVYAKHPEIQRLANEIYDVYRPHCEEVIGRKFKKEYTNGYLNRNMFGDTVWTHADPFDYTLVVYLNPDSYDLRKWGGETLFFNDDITFSRGAVAPKGSTACLFKSDIPHKVTSVSWEADFDRLAITYYLEYDDTRA